MQTLPEVMQFLENLKAEQGTDAVRAWVVQHATELPKDVRDEVVFTYSVEAFLEDAEERAVLQDVAKASLNALDDIEEEKKAIEAELKTRAVKERLSLGTDSTE